MKIVFALFLPAIALAGISNVRMAGTTSTQAVIAYTAPDNNACTLAVSTSPSYTPSVPDLDPTLFSGASVDSRTGNLSIGRARFFVVGKRSVEKNLKGTNSSRALESAVTHYFQISCPADGSTAGGSFTTATIPSGISYGEPIPIDPANNGNYIYPAMSATDRAAWVIEPHTGARVKNLALPNDLTGGTPSMSSGVGVACHPTPVKASDEDKYGYHCVIMYSGGYPGLYWIATDGEARFLGGMNSNANLSAGWNFNNTCMGLLSASFDATDPNTFYCWVSPGDSDNTIALKAVYNGHRTGQDQDLTNQPYYAPNGMPNTTYTQTMPWSRNLQALLREFDPNFTTYGLACCTHYLRGDWANNKFVFELWGPDGQDSYGWVAVYDVNQTAAMQQAKFGSAAGCVDNPAVTGQSYSGMAGCLVASTGTFSGGPGSAFRWSGLHGLLVTPASTFVGVSLASPDVTYQVTLTSALSAAPGTCTMAKPAGSYIPDWPDASWSYGCSTITVSGAPKANSNKTGYPTSMPAAPGDFVSAHSNGGNFRLNELMRLLDTGTDGKTWYIQRRYFYGTQWPYSAVSTGGTLDMMTWSVYNNINSTGRMVWWDINNGGLVTNLTNTYRDTLPPDHAAYVNHPVYGRWSTTGSWTQGGTEPGRLTNPPALLPQGVPAINGQTVSVPVEGHPALPISNPPDAVTYNQIVDNHPYYGGSPVSASNVTLVGGQLYRIRGLSVASLYKLVPNFANSGSRAMKEVSGPSVRLATDASAQFQWCVALFAGECSSGSLAGDIYFNAPGVTNAYCTDNWSTLMSTMTIPNDICVGQAHTMVQAVKMAGIANDPQGLQFRAISTALGKYEQQSSFWNSRAVPDGSWLYTSVAMDSTVKLIKVPPRSTDTVNRTNYIPIGIAVAAQTGVSNVTVEFGYAENGSPGAYYCTARQEACVAQGAAINFAQPFYFGTTEAQAITGMPCTSGCTVVVPAISGRMVYYRVNARSSSGAVVSQQTGVQAVP
jgi:hypothetical protein